MSWKELILKPEITLIPSGEKDNFKKPSHFIFNIKITFVDPAYPVLKYSPDYRFPVGDLATVKAVLLTNMEDEVNAWVLKNDFLATKGATINNFLNNQTWGAA